MKMGYFLLDNNKRTTLLTRNFFTKTPQNRP